jgi:hypothetical protein
MVSIPDQAGSAWLWDLSQSLDDLTPISLAGHRGAVNALSFSPDESMLATGSSDGTVRVWPLVSGPAAPEPVELQSVTDGVFGVLFSRDGKHLISTGAFQDAVVWDMRDEALFSLATKSVNRNLTWAEWSAAFPGQAYRPMFPNLPVDASVIHAALDQVETHKSGLNGLRIANVFAQAAIWAGKSKDAIACDEVFRRAYARGIESTTNPAFKEEMRQAPSLGWLYRTAGAVAANRGNLADAIRFFESYIAWSGIHEYAPISDRERCAGWLAELRKGANPFRDRRSLLLLGPPPGE